MQILLLSMPDSFEHTPTVAVRMPNGALASLAGNLDPHHRVAIADLVLVQASVRRTVEQLVRDLQPELVGLSVMTFQRGTARRIISLIQSIKPGVRIVVGGYDPSLAPEAWTHQDLGVDAIVRGEGELTFRELVRALDERTPLDRVAGLWFRDAHGFQQTAPRPITAVENGTLQPPNRAARVLTGYTVMGRNVDVVETSRGCTFDCSFCSIIEMRGRNFHRFPMERVIDDIRDARSRGARAIFIVDDNITLDVARFKALCKAIIDAGLDDLDYMVQGMTSPIAAHGAELAPLMRRAGFRYVFLGIENILDDDLSFLKAAAKNSQREQGRRVGNASTAAVEILRKHGMFVIGGLIVGNPDDTAEAIEANLEFARKYVDWPYIQHPTPYPGTPMTRDFVERGLVVNRRVEEYRRNDGGDAEHAPHRGGDRVHAVEGRAMDEASAFSAGASPRSALSPSPRSPDGGAYLPRIDVAIAGRTRERPHGVRTISGASRARTRVCRLARSVGRWRRRRTGPFGPGAGT